MQLYVMSLKEALRWTNNWFDFAPNAQEINGLVTTEN